MKNILLFGAGKSSTILIDYLKKITTQRNWTATIVDANYEQIVLKTKHHPNLNAVQIDIHDAQKRKEIILQADIVISLMPPDLHILIAKDCIACKKNLLTASYIDEATKDLAKDIEANGLLFLYEMGLDPGIDHMSAMQLIHKLQANNETITKFYSHCGGLVADDSDDNIWHYKISWNPKNVVMAGKSGAIFLENNQIKQLSYLELFKNIPLVKTPTNQVYAYYPNRDSISYINLYGLKNVTDFVRTTLRHPNFMMGWGNLLNYKLTNEDKIYQTNGMSFKEFFKEHRKAVGLVNWAHDLIEEKLANAQSMMDNLLNMMDTNSEGFADNLMMVDENGNLNNLSKEEVKSKATASIFDGLDVLKIKLDQLFFLGLDDNETIINKGLCSAADVLQFILENKLALKTNEKDKIVMLHEIETIKNGNITLHKSFLQLDGNNNQETAMAKTVGLPLGIAATLILDKEIQAIGLHIPITPNIYNPVLKALEQEGIKFTEYTL